MGSDHRIGARTPKGREDVVARRLGELDERLRAGSTDVEVDRNDDPVALESSGVVTHGGGRVLEVEQNQTADHGVEAIRLGVGADVGLDEANVLVTGLGCSLPRDLEQRGLGIDADHLAVRSDDLGTSLATCPRPLPRSRTRIPTRSHPAQELDRRCLVERRLRVEAGDLVLLASKDVGLPITHPGIVAKAGLGCDDRGRPDFGQQRVDQHLRPLAELVVEQSPVLVEPDVCARDGEPAVDDPGAGRAQHLSKLLLRPDTAE